MIGWCFASEVSVCFVRRQVPLFHENSESSYWQLCQPLMKQLSCLVLSSIANTSYCKLYSCLHSCYITNYQRYGDKIEQMIFDPARKRLPANPLDPPRSYFCCNISQFLIVGCKLQTSILSFFFRQLILYSCYQERLAKEGQ